MKFRYPTTLFVFLTLLWIKAIYPASSGIADTDFYWHLTYGEWIIEHGRLPAGDTFSWTMAGEPYQLTQWLGEAVMGQAYRICGLDGTKFVSVLLAGITLWFAWKAAERYVHPSIALGLAVLCNLVQIVMPMRPQLFTFALLAVGAWLVTGWLSTEKQRHLLGYPIVMALWVNLHGGFVVGLVLICLTAIGLTLEAIEKGAIRSDKSLAFVWGIVVASLAATLVNPYGYKAITTVLMIGGLRSASVISEWAPVNITTELGWFYLMNLVPFIALIAITGVKPRLTIGLIAGFFLVFGILANRQVALCAAVMAPMTASLLARTPQYLIMVSRTTDPSRPILYGLLSAGLIAAFPAIASIGNERWKGSMNLQYPIVATEFLERNGLSRRVMSDTLEASYLIHRRVPVFIDGRMDLYRDRFFFEWYLASRAAPGWEKLIAKHRPDALLLRHDMALRQVALASGQWKQVYEDARYSILVPIQSKLAAVSPSTPDYLDDEGRLLRPYMP